MIKACIFDLDGTLLDTIESIRYYANKALSNHGIHGITLAQTKIFVGNGALELIKRSMNAAGVDTEGIE